MRAGSMCGVRLVGISYIQLDSTTKPTILLYLQHTTSSRVVISEREIAVPRPIGVRILSEHALTWRSRRTVRLDPSIALAASNQPRQRITSCNSRGVAGLCDKSFDPGRLNPPTIDSLAVFCISKASTNFLRSV